MNPVWQYLELSWQNLTLSALPLTQWRNTSSLHRLVGALRSWQRGSWLMQWADQIGVLLLSLVFGLAPFVSTSLVGILLAACVAYWVLLTVSDEMKPQPEQLGDRLQNSGDRADFLGRMKPQPEQLGDRLPVSSDSELQETTTPKSTRFSFPGATPIHWLVALYWSVVTVATAFSPVKKAALVGWGKLTLYLLLFALMARVLRSPRLRSWLITLYLHVSLVVSIYGIQQWIAKVPPKATWNDPTSLSANATRAYSYLGNPNLLAGYLLPAIALSLAAVFAWRSWGAKALALTMLIVHCACLLFTDSRGSWIGFVILLGVFFLLLFYWLQDRLPRFWRTWFLPIGFGTVAGLGLLMIVLVEPLRDRISSIFVSRGNSSNNYRINVWGSVLHMIRDHPVLGIGPGNNAFNKIYPLYQRPKFSALSAYSIFLEVAVESGLIGLTCFLWLLLVIFNQGWVQLQRLKKIGSSEGFWLIAAIAALWGMLGHGLVDTVWYRPEVSTLWWLMVAIIATYYNGHESDQTLASPSASNRVS